MTFGGEFANRTVRTSLEGVAPRVDSLTDRTSFAFGPGLGLSFDRQLSRGLAFSVQVRYQTAGYKFKGGDPSLDAQTGEVRRETFTTETIRHDFVALPLGVINTWGSSALRYYTDIYVTPMLYVATTAYTKYEIIEARRRSRANIDRVNDFHLGVRAGLGVERLLSDVLRLRAGIGGVYHFTQTNDGLDLKEALFSFGPQVSIARVFGQASSPTGKADEIYY